MATGSSNVTSIVIRIVMVILLLFIIVYIAKTQPAHVTYIVSIVITIIGIFIMSFIDIITFVGSNDNRVWLKEKLETITYLSLGGTATAIIAGLIFYSIKPDSMMYLLLFVAFMGFGLAWAACAIALIKRK